MYITLSIWTILAIYMLIGVIFAEASELMDRRSNKGKIPILVYIFTSVLWAPLLIALAIRNRTD